MSNIHLALIPLVTSCLIMFSLSVFLTWVVQYLTKRYALLDVPNERSSHKQPIPRGGGITFVLLFSLASLVFALLNLITLAQGLALIVGGLLIASIGLWDDIQTIPAKLRILIHLTAAIWAVYWLAAIPSFDFGFIIITAKWFCYLISFLIIIWLLNLYNFMDGIDGLAAVEGIFVAFAVGILFVIHNENSLAWLCALMGSAIAGFLVFNWSPARIFMGDVGSAYLGYILALLVLMSDKEPQFSIWAWFILLGVFIVDTTFTLIRRILKGKAFYHAHRSHAYQLVALRLQSHAKVCSLITLINVIWLFPMALIAVKWPSYGFYALIIAYIPLVSLAIFCKAGLDSTQKSV